MITSGRLNGLGNPDAALLRISGSKGGLVYTKMPTTAPISIVITTYNRSDALLCVLQALELQNDTNFEVVIADDGSADAHVEPVMSAMEKFTYPVTHVWHPDVGFTAAKVRNLGVVSSSGQYLILLDGDCIPDVDFVSQHRLLAEQRRFVNGSRVLLSESFTHLVLTGNESVSAQSPRRWLLRRACGASSKWAGWLRLPDMSLREQRKFKWKGIRSCNMALWKSDYIAVNGFDETFVGWGHEDADFVLRLHNCGLVRKNGFSLPRFTTYGIEKVAGIWKTKMLGASGNESAVG